MSSPDGSTAAQIALSRHALAFADELTATFAIGPPPGRSAGDWMVEESIAAASRFVLAVRDDPRSQLLPSMDPPTFLLAFLTAVGSAFATVATERARRFAASSLN